MNGSAVVGMALLAMMISRGGTAGQEGETGFLDHVVRVAGHEYPYQVYVPRDYTTATRWPVILFLHGAGERGHDGLRQTAVGLGAAVRLYPERYPAIIVFPQTPTDSTWTGAPAAAAMAALDRTMADFSVDPSRVYLTGMSMGGNGTWYLAYRKPERFAAVVPVCAWVEAAPRFSGSEPVVPASDGPPFEALARRLSGIPIWLFHGEVDPAVPVDQSRQAAAALKAAAAEGVAAIRYTELPGTGHNAWDPAYMSPEFAAWLMAQRR